MCGAVPVVVTSRMLGSYRIKAKTASILKIILFICPGPSSREGLRYSYPVFGDTGIPKLCHLHQYRHLNVELLFSLPVDITLQWLIQHSKSRRS